MEVIEVLMLLFSGLPPFDLLHLSVLFRRPVIIMKILRAVVLVLVFSSLGALAQMVSPDIDRPGEPFSYFSQPTDVIGVMDAPTATLVSPEGFFYTGYGELMFFTGNPSRPIHQRVKTLERGYLPIIHYSFTRDGIEYRFTAFAATLDGTPSGTLVDFIRVQVTNTSNSSATAWLGAAMRYEGNVNTPGGVPDNRYRRPFTPKRPGGYTQLGVEFNPDWVYGFDGSTFRRDGKLMYSFPSQPSPQLHLTMKEGYNENGDLKPRKLQVLPTTPVGFVQYPLPLAPGQSTTLDFKIPVVPLEPNADHAQYDSADFDTFLPRVVDFWERILATGIDIAVPEEKVNDTFKASLIYDLIARDKIGNDYIQTVNKFHYHAFWLRDSSYIVRMYDLSGYHDFARQDLDFFAGWQQPDGNFVSQGGQFDGWGQTLWAYGEHYRITGDRAFAEKVLPPIRRAVAWLQQARASDPLHLMPKTSPGDNEDISGHVTGHNFWALAGLKNAIDLANGVGATADAKAFQREYDDYFAAFKKVLDQQTAATHGYMQPGLDSTGGQDWGNMLAVYPEIILDPHDPLVTATLNATRAKYKEGIMTYGDGQFLHHYLTMKNTETETIRGDQKMAIEELYAMLVHTSSTQAGFEFAIHPWGTRDFGLNLSPHGWFAAKFRSALRNMLVREQGDDLHLLSVTSPEWFKPGNAISVKRAPTNFGQVEFTLKVDDDSHASLDLNTSFRAQPKRIILHAPWFLTITEITAGGKPLKPGREVVLPLATRHVELHFTRDANAPSLNYASAVEQYKKDFRSHYEEFVKTGK
jgi:hypothetical protein